MIDAVSTLAGRAAEMRQEFDRGFAEAAAAGAEIDAQDLLAIRLNERRYALRLSQIAGLSADKKITRVPGGGRLLLGIAGFRGVLIPVYDLGVLLGHSGGGASRWLVVSSAAPVALAFAAFEGQLRAADEAILPQSGDNPAGHATGFVRTGEAVRPILDLHAIVAGLGASGPMSNR